MRNLIARTLVGLTLVGLLSAQGAEAGGGKGTAPAVKHPVGTAEAGPKVSDAGRTALNAAKQVAGRCRGLRGAERTIALEQAATAYDKVATEFAGEPVVAAMAAFTAAELWQKQGSLPLAEKGYLLAATADAGRFAQRGLLGAADMQRRQKRTDEALATYARAAAVEPGSARAQDARLWQARLLQSGERIDDAIAMFQSALESADPGSQTIEAANFLALAWIQKGDLDAAGHVLDHAEQSIAEIGDEDPLVTERLHKAVEAMSAKKALQRARDKQNGAGKDAASLDASRQRQG